MTNLMQHYDKTNMLKEFKRQMIQGYLTVISSNS